MGETMGFHVTLMHPPLDDPTLPYHANAYLAGHLRFMGHEDVGIRDINIEYVNFCLEPDSIRFFHAELELRIAELGSRSSLSYQEQENYYRLLAVPRFTEEELVGAVGLFKAKDDFLDYAAYTEAMDRINGYFGMLGALSYPGEIDNFTLKSRGRYSPYSLVDLLSADLAEKLCFPFVRFFERRLSNDEELSKTDMFGISVVYDHQLVHSLHFARMLKRLWPEKKVVLGGTAISQLYKYLKVKHRIKLFFKLCDAMVIGEGESALCEIVRLRGEFSAGVRISNTITYDSYRDELEIPVIKYEDVSSLGPPLYDYRWDLYLSPERGINYSPTRGCYWNRCTFCDYGLNFEKPTSPWRERRLEQVIEDLRSARDRFGVRYVYLAVDVMAPSYMEKMADAIIKEGIEIRWSSEIRLEKAFKKEKVAKIAASGAISLSFGMESGNQRVLDLIDKGTKLEYMSEAMRNFAEAGVAVQLMAFTGFPTETVAEAEETRQFIRNNEPWWSAGGLGQFLLTGTAIIARQPEKFGIRIIETQDADIGRAITYTMGDDEEKRSNLAEEADGSFDDSASEFPGVLGRPWAGGTDTLHSMIYYEHFGRNAFKTHTVDSLDTPPPEDDSLLMHCRIAVFGRLVESPIDLSLIFRNRQLLVQYLKEKLETPAEPTYDSFLEWEQDIPRVSAGSESTFWLVSPTSAVRLGQLVYQLLGVAQAQSLTVGELVGGLRQDIAQRLTTHFRDMATQRLIAFVDGSHTRAARSEGQGVHSLLQAVDERVAPAPTVFTNKLVTVSLPAKA